MTDQRKASDILIVLEKKMEEILAYQKNQDLLIKRLSQQISELQRNAQSDRSILSTGIDNKTTELKTLPGLKPGIKIGNYQSKDPGEKIEIKKEDFIEEISEPKIDLKELNKKRGTRLVNSNKPMPVKQALKYPDGRPLAMAKIDIYDIDRLNLVSSVKSSILGEWVENLLPNKYSVNIFKKAAGDKPEVSIDFVLDVPSSETPLKLDDLIVPST